MMVKRQILGLIGLSAAVVAMTSPGYAQTPSPGPATVDMSTLVIPLAIVALLELGGLIFMALKLKGLQSSLAMEKQASEQAQKRLESQALYDALTQLPNRRLFWDRMMQTIKIANRNKARVGIIMADLDKFKPINDTMGHEAGDLLLKEVSVRLQKVIRESDTVARLGGDEFAFICPGMEDRASAATISMRIINAMQEPFVILGQPHEIGISLGLAVFPDHATDAEVLVRRADSALYRAKEKRNTFVIYDPKIDHAKSGG